MKRTISTLLAVLMVLTAFGVSTLFGGVLGASAEFYDYYVYTQFPGFNAFNADDFALAWSSYLEYSGRSSAFLPDGDPVAEVSTFTVKAGTQGSASIGTMRQRNADPQNNSQNVDYHNSPNWTANDKLNGKDIFTGTDVNFDDANGFCFWAGLNGGRYEGQIKVSLFTTPSQGPYYSKSEDGSTDMSTAPTGFVYSSDLIRPDEDGYYYFNFRTDFSQTDWWSVDDNGVKQNGNGKTPVPDSKLPQINALEIRFNSGLQEGDVIYAGDFRAFRDTRVYYDELNDLCMEFDAINSEEYTEDSYAAALEVYLEAYGMLQDITAYSQKRINAMAVELRAAIRDLKPMFMAAKKEVKLAGFEVWDDNDFDDIYAGGVCLDTAMVDDTNVPKNREQSVLVFANAQDGPPTYGWSEFTNATEDGAVDNPFALLEGSAPLSEADGIRFWLKWDESMLAVPNAARIGLGVSSEELYFECEETAVELPLTQGYVGAPWSAFYDMDGEEDIFDYIDEIDAFYLYIEGATGIYYIADLTGFEWSYAPADFTELIKTINDAKAYMKTLNKADYYFVSWNNVEDTIARAEDMLTQYAVTDEDVEAMIDSIGKSINWLTPLGDLAREETINELKGLCQNGKTYWRGNVTPRSYIELSQQIENAETLLWKGPKQVEAEEAIAALKAAIAGLVPIKAGEKVTSIFSFESYSGRDLSRASGDRTENVTYSLDKTFAKLPEGYGQALKMTAKEDMTSETKDEHGMMQFKAMYRDGGNHVVPIMIGNDEDPKANTLIGDLSGTDGICLWVGVNDVNLVQECAMRFSVSNCSVGPYFERSAIDIPIPATGSGWIYLPWEYFEYYDWTDEELNLAKIYFYIIRFDGAIKAGLEVYITGIHAYKNVANGTWETPVVSNISEGGEYDVSEQALIPDWNVGAAMLDGEALIYGNSVLKNGEHTLVVTNGDKSVTVNFTTTGAAEYATPVVNVENGGEYTAPLTLTWDVGIGTLNGEVIENGAVVEAPGGYVLEVINGTKSVSVRFNVKDELPPPPPVKKGDPTGNGKIEVDDALAALRVAAKLAEPTDELLAACDIDGNGKIEVDDALAILRVAAKLADESSLG